MPEPAYKPGPVFNGTITSFDDVIECAVPLPRCDEGNPEAREFNQNRCRQLMWHLMRNERDNMTLKLSEAIDRWWDSAMDAEDCGERYVVFVNAGKRVCDILAPLKTLSLRKALLQTDEECEQREREYSHAREEHQKRKAAAHAATA